MHTPHDQSGDVRHIGNQVGTDLIRNLPPALEIPETWVGRGTGNDHLRAYVAHLCGDPVEIQNLGVGVHAVVHEAVPASREVDGAAVGQMSALVEIEGHHRVARLQQRVIDGHVHLRAAERLHVGVLGAEQLLGARDRQTLDRVHVAAAVVVARARHTLGVLVAEDSRLRRRHHRAAVVLRRDHHQRVALSLLLRRKNRRRLWIEIAKVHSVTPFWE